MRRYILLIVSMLCLTISAQQQEKQQGEQKGKPCMTPQEFQKKQQEYLAQHAHLTEEESAAFFPLYFELQDKKHEINGRVWKTARAVRPHERTEEECNEMIDAWADMKIECAMLEKEYLTKFKEILSAKKLMRIQMAEDRFQRELLRGMQQGGRGKKQEKP